MIVEESVIISASAERTVSSRAPDWRWVKVWALGRGPDTVRSSSRAPISIAIEKAADSSDTPEPTDTPEMIQLAGEVMLNGSENEQ